MESHDCKLIDDVLLLYCFSYRDFLILVLDKRFHTGDLGTLDSSGWLKVTGRLKEQYKLENGKYVCPTPIEEAIGMSRFVMQVVLCGANRPYNVALIVPDWIAIKTKLGIDLPDDELAND